jgi:hypothetical protein
VAVAVIKPAPGSAILAAALALPGLALADNRPEQASLSVKYLDYQDSQHNLDRVHVRSPSLDLVLPLAGPWSIHAGLVSDAISGASPRYHTAVSGASHFEDKRTGVDVSVTRYFERASVTVAAGSSTEDDYDSRFYSVQANVSSADNNTTWLFGAGVANDRIDPTAKTIHERKHSNDFLLGVTQVLTPRDLVQLVLTHMRGNGYFTMPYKYVDARPRERTQDTMLLRWNHHLQGSGVTMRMQYRYARDSWKIASHTVQGEFVHPVGSGWTVTPLVRLYSQSAARFYIDPVYSSIFGPPFPPGYDFRKAVDISADQRLSAFGAVTAGLKLEKEIGRNTSVDFKWEEYRQQGSWRLFGSGSPGLEPFKARSIQLGLSHRW